MTESRFPYWYNREFGISRLFQKSGWEMRRSILLSSSPTERSAAPRPATATRRSLQPPPRPPVEELRGMCRTHVHGGKCSDSARARGPGSLAGLPRFFRSVAHEGRGCNPGPRACSARRGRAVTCARGGVACGCTATTYRDLRPGGYYASGACSTRRVTSMALVVVCGRRPYFERRRRHVRQQDSPRDYQE